MKGEVNERWQLLCQLAAQEQDPDKLLELVAAIDRMLNDKFERLDQQRPEKKNGTGLDLLIEV